MSGLKRSWGLYGLEMRLITAAVKDDTPVWVYHFVGADIYMGAWVSLLYFNRYFRTPVATSASVVSESRDLFSPPLNTPASRTPTPHKIPGPGLLQV